MTLVSPGSDRVRDRGSVSAFVVMLVMTFVACAGLALDGGRVVGAHSRAADLAENAARAGAQEITGIRAGSWEIDPRRARATARAYLAAQGASGTVTTSRTRVTVTVTLTSRPSLLRLIGIGPRTVRASRSSEPVSP